MSHRRILHSLIVIALVAILSYTVLVRTTINPLDCGAEVVVKIAFYGTGVNQTVLDTWEREAEALWKGPFGYQPYGDCKCRLNFNFIFQRVANAAACPNDSHCVEVYRVPPAGHTTSVSTGNAPGTGFDNGPYTSQSTGKFVESDRGTTVAHEIGHLIGLDDEYMSYTSNFTVGTDGTITINKLTITYPPGMATTDAHRQKVAEELKRKLEAGEIVRGRTYVRRYYSLQPGAKNTSIMGQEPGFPWVALPEHIGQISTNRRLVCEDRYCCGNGVLDAGKGEECDKNMTPAGCAEPKPVCNSQCKCEGTTTTTTLTDQPTSSTVEGQTTTSVTITEDTLTPTTTTFGGCTTSADCGEQTKKYICKENDVYEQTATPSCKSPGTPSSACVWKLTDRKYMDCEPGRCVAGVCEGKETTTTIPSAGGCCDCQLPFGCASGLIITAGSCPDACYPYEGTFVANAICSLTTGNCVPATTTTVQDGTITTTSTARITTTSTVRTTTTTIVIVECGSGLYDGGDCDGRCNSACERCNIYGDSPCYYCQKDCTMLGTGWGTSTKCSTCDYSHQDCVQHGTCTGCYHCVDIPSVCGDRRITTGEQCESGVYECGNQERCVNCQCITDCSALCAAQGNGYSNYGGTDSLEECSAEANSLIPKEDCKSKCVKYAFYAGHTANCCCAKTNELPCTNCPCTKPCTPNCPSEATCLAGI